LKRFAALLLLLALASTARASGVSLRWGGCEGTANRNFACDKSTGQELLVGSFAPPSGIGELRGIEVIISIAAADGRAPSWWQTFGAGGCRRGSIAATFDVSDQMECDDPWNGQAGGGNGTGGPDHADMWLVAAVPPSAAHGVQSGRKYSAFKLIINHQKSNGPGACSGCETPVCIRLEAIRLVLPPRPDPQRPGGVVNVNVDLTDGISGMGGASQVATWQGGNSNCAAGLAKPSTWSELKSRFKSK
jgi:hypothetical protein